MSKTFAIADLHGRFDLFSKAVAFLEDGNPAGGKIVFLGDYVDRGPQSKEIITALMAGPSDSKRWQWVCLKGNHEDMMVSTIGGPDEGWWLGNGGTATVKSYDGHISADHLVWCSNLPMWHQDQHRVFVHAAVDPTKALHEQSEAVLLWQRYQNNADITYPGKHIVHGHTPVPDGPVLHPGRTNLDTGAYFTDRLVVAAFDDDKAGGPRSFSTIVSHPFN